MQTNLTLLEFKTIVNDVVCPFFPGSEIRESTPIIPGYHGVPIVAQLKQPRNLRILPYVGATWGIEFYRMQSFSDKEKAFIRILIECSQRLYDIDQKYYNEVLSSIQTEAVASFVMVDSKFLYQVLLLLNEWAMYTYEGQKISTSIGIEESETGPSDLHFDSVKFMDFIKILGNGHDSLMIYDKVGNFHGYANLNFTEAEATGYYPLRFIHIAGWSQNDKTCVTLTRNGDVLIFQNGDLLFAKRMGKWIYYTHDVIQKQFTNNAIAKNTNPELRRAIYKTALDLSYSRTGGCIGVVNQTSEENARKSRIIAEDERFDNGSSNIKVSLLQKIICNRPFYDLDRLLRLELASIDGATVINRQGSYIAAGSIVKVKGGSTSGGRTAATKALSNFGIGIKISNDGYIEAYDRNQKRLFRIG